MLSVANPSLATSIRPIRVLIVDDSAVVRTLLTRELGKDRRIEVVGSAPDPYVARDMIVSLRPDVLTLDVEMPRMDGITFLRKLMEHFPMPVIVVSSLTAAGTRTAIEALDAGAVEIVAKPGSSYTVDALSSLLIDKVILAARTKVNRIVPSKFQSDSLKSHTKALSQTTNQVVAIGSSTGGVQALTTILTALPATTPGIMIVQHMPEHFTKSLAERLDGICKIRVKEAAEGDTVSTGAALIAPGGKHLTLRRSGAQYLAHIQDGPEVCHQRPAADVLFDSVAQNAGSNAVGVVLTGMGCDGAAGLLKMRQAGARTLVQDQATCVVFGMPMEAIKRGAAEHIVPLPEIAQKILALSNAAAR